MVPKWDHFSCRGRCTGPYVQAGLEATSQAARLKTPDRVADAAGRLAAATQS
jgi:hypothetical protein